jgi:2-keto-4-pentenoate hydratase/2-oxohepta-3-ene-1,7-dioic acid hydratase in catechol pathway
MKLLNFYTSEKSPHLGVVEGGQVFDLSAAMRSNPLFSSVVSFIRGGTAAARAAKDELNQHGADTSLWQAFDTLEHGPLVPRECRIFAVGLNYADHAAENQLAPPDTPIIFDKLASTITPHNQAVPLPVCSNQVDYEAEFALVIGRPVKCVAESEAAQFIAGYTIVNDVTARDLQLQDKQWFRGKNCDGFAPLGPYLVTADEIPDPDNLEIRLRLNGRTMQHSNTRNLFFKPSKLIAFLSQSLKLEAGDVITTGTPGGIGYFSNPQVFLKAGDTIEVEVERIGVLRNTVSARPNSF